jgi:hypothetical protein
VVTAYAVPATPPRPLTTVLTTVSYMCGRYYVGRTRKEFAY